MKKAILTCLTLTVLALVAAAGYIAYPVATAWTIREAVRNGDAAYLERKVAWARVRATLKSSMTSVAFDMPEPDSSEAVAKPGLWTQVKAYFGRSAVNRFVDSYVTPEGLPRLFEYRRVYRQAVAAESDERALPLRVRFSRFWSRLKRAEFKTLTAFEVELEDRYDTSRRHVGLLELEGLEWRLTELRVKTVQPEPSYATAVLPTDRRVNL